MTPPVPAVVQFSTRKEGVLPLWDHCVELPNIYTCPVERFLQVLSAQYAAPISERHPGLADAGEGVQVWACKKGISDPTRCCMP